MSALQHKATMEQQPSSPTQRPSKRARLCDDDTAQNGSGGGGDNTDIPPMNIIVSDLQEDMCIKIAGFLHFKDLNELACVSKKWQVIRNKPCLDQTREIQLNFSDGISQVDQTVQLLDRMAQKADRYPQYTRLTVCNLHPDIDFPIAYDPLPWQYITHVFLSEVSTSAIVLNRFFSGFPNLGYLHMHSNHGRRYAGVIPGTDAFQNVPFTNTLVEIRWSVTGERRATLDFTGRIFGNLSALRRLNIDGATIFNPFARPHFLGEVDDRIESLSCTGLRCITPGDDPNSHLIRFVRRARHLRWLKSDLPPEQIAELKPDFPQVTFASA